jgi:ATPase subunit of ABC transporter with duplicated ATPase domains
MNKSIAKSRPIKFKFINPTRHDYYLSISEGCFGYDKEYLFDDFNIHISGQDRIAIVGPNGSGKSTLLKIMNGDLTLTEGEMIKHAVVSYLHQLIPYDESITPTEYMCRTYRMNLHVRHWVM